MPVSKITNSSCFFFVPGDQTSCDALKPECASCKGCKFFKDINDKKNTTLMNEFKSWHRLRLPYSPLFKETQ